MPDQTIKHDSALPGFLLILIPAAFLAVFLSIAWPFIVGGVLLLTGNNLWQSYQWAKLSQQVNPIFSQLVVERRGQITPADLSNRARISSSVADRYLNNKAVQLGGVSYRRPDGAPIYSFLTVATLDRALAEVEPEASLDQKLAELEPLPAPPALVTPPTPIDVPPEPTAPKPLVVEQPVTPVVAPAAEPVATPVQWQEESIEPEAPKAILEVVPETAVPPAPEPVTEAAGSDFAQALKQIFNSPPAAQPEGEPEVVVEAEAIAAVEIISQVDLAKRLDVHASTIYKRRGDVSFADWTRNRDPEGVAWGYDRETKEFYRIG
jgi:hypothetical protein